VGLKVLELVMGQHQQLQSDPQAPTGLSWVLGGDAKDRRRQGVKLWPPPPAGGDEDDEDEELVACERLIDEADLRQLDAEVGPGYVVKDGFLGASALAALRDEVALIHASGQLKPAGMVAHDQQRWAESSARGNTHSHSLCMRACVRACVCLMSSRCDWRAGMREQATCTCGWTWRA
jgi:hypothetical protein